MYVASVILQPRVLSAASHLRWATHWKIQYLPSSLPVAGPSRLCIYESDFGCLNVSSVCLVRKSCATRSQMLKLLPLQVLFLINWSHRIIIFMLIHCKVQPIAAIEIPCCCLKFKQCMNISTLLSLLVLDGEYSKLGLFNRPNCHVIAGKTSFYQCLYYVTLLLHVPSAALCPADKFPAAAFIGWIRIARPGSILGP